VRYKLCYSSALSIPTKTYNSSSTSNSTHLMLHKS